MLHLSYSNSCSGGHQQTGWTSRYHHHLHTIDKLVCGHIGASAGSCSSSPTRNDLHACLLCGTEQSVSTPALPHLCSRIAQKNISKHHITLSLLQGPSFPPLGHSTCIGLGRHHTQSDQQPCLCWRSSRSGSGFTFGMYYSVWDGQDGWQ